MDALKADQEAELVFAFVCPGQLDVEPSVQEAFDFAETNPDQAVRLMERFDSEVLAAFR